jgi:hypothetical protein
MAQHFDEPPKREKPQPVVSINVECRLEGQPVHAAYPGFQVAMMNSVATAIEAVF